LLPRDQEIKGGVGGAKVLFLAEERDKSRHVQSIFTKPNDQEKREVKEKYEPEEG